jgi:hypothetical protein
VLGVSAGGLQGFGPAVAGVSNGWVRVVVAQCAEVAVADRSGQMIAFRGHSCPRLGVAGFGFPRAVGHSWRASVQQGRAAARGLHGRLSSHASAMATSRAHPFLS